jgi:ABC transporter with metal-binding/Fe-S-binding domain ATP-binding protein
MRLAALYSGGKDSTFAIMKALEEGHTVEFLVTIAPKSSDSYMFHYPCIELTKLQAEAMGIKQIWRESEGKKEVEIEDLASVLSTLKGQVDGILSGAVSSNYQRSRIEQVCRSLGLMNVAPLWGRDAYDLLREEANSGIDAMITSVSTGGMDKTWLGRKLNAIAVEELRMLARKLPFNIQFEGGEAETLVTDCPLFKSKILIKNFEKFWDSKTSSGYIVVKEATLEKKI